MNKKNVLLYDGGQRLLCLDHQTFSINKEANFQNQSYKVLHNKIRKYQKKQDKHKNSKT